MSEEKKPDIVWKDIAGLINKLPEKERKQYYDQIGNFMHDLNHLLGMIYNAEALVRRDLAKSPSEYGKAIEWLDVLRNNYKLTHQKLRDMGDTLFEGIEIDD